MKLEIVFKDGRKEILDSVESFNVIVKQNANKAWHPFEVAWTPSEGKLFEVNPLGIDRSIFEKPMIEEWEKWTQEIIQEAFTEVDKYPEKYASPFYTLIPEKNWNGLKKVKELQEYANDLGGYTADWVEQALEWAQRISNGESWMNICFNADTASYYRMIIWKNGYARIVGGSHKVHDCSKAVYIRNFNLNPGARLSNTVPLVAFKKE